MLFLLMLVQATVGPDVAVTTIDGTSHRGELVAIDESKLALRTESSPVSIPIRELQIVAVGTSPGARTDKLPITVRLVDDSLLMAKAYTVTGGTANIVLPSETLKLPTRRIASVRLRPALAALDEQWQQIATAKAAGDVIVLHRSDEALDQLEGVFQEVTDEKVDFHFEDELIPVNRTKLEGLVYFHAVRGALPDPLCSIHDTNGSHWQVAHLKQEDGRVLLTTRCGVEIRRSWAQLVRLEFGSSNSTFLSDLDFRLEECTPYIESRIDPERLLKLYQPRRDRGFAGPGLWLSDGSTTQRFDKGLAIHSRSVLTFRLAGQYRKLLARAGIDRRVQGRGSVDLVVTGDQRELFRRMISGKDEPVPIELDVAGVQRLRITVDFGDTLDVADHLNLCNARVIK